MNTYTRRIFQNTLIKRVVWSYPFDDATVFSINNIGTMSCHLAILVIINDVYLLQVCFHKKLIYV